MRRWLVAVATLAILMTGLANTAGAAGRTWSHPLHGFRLVREQCHPGQWRKRSAPTLSPRQPGEFQLGVTWHNVALVSPSTAGNVTGTLHRVRWSRISREQDGVVATAPPAPRTSRFSLTKVRRGATPPC